MKTILAINPVIYDFSAYDSWLKPYGFLHLISALKKENLKIEFLDCLDRFYPELKNYLKKPLKQTPDGRGKFLEEKIPKPKSLNHIPRYYRRYGLPEKLIENFVKNTKPDLILVTSSMSYWYPGVKEIIRILKNHLPSIPIILGGNYASLCKKHAQKEIRADFVISNNNLYMLSKILKDILNIELNIKEIYHLSPCYGYYSYLPYIVLRTSWGCPFNCNYCGIKQLQPEFITRDIETVLEEIKKYYSLGVKNFTFYDDALLYQPERIKYLLQKVIQGNIKVRFYTPNGLHIRFIDQKLADLMYQTHFINPRLSLESIDENFQKTSGGKVYNYELERAINFLRKAGYEEFQYSVYLLIGLPGEDLEIVKKSIEYVKKLKAKPLLAEYSPIPGTEIAEKIKYPLEEPLYHNNSIFPAYELKDWQTLQEVKHLVHNIY